MFLVVCAKISIDMYIQICIHCICMSKCIHVGTRICIRLYILYVYICKGICMWCKAKCIWNLVSTFYFSSHSCIQPRNACCGNCALWGNATGNSPHWVYSSSTTRTELIAQCDLMRVHASKNKCSDEWVYVKVNLWINIHTCKCMYTCL